METFTARNPVDLIALVPFVIGFHPEDSVVLLTVGSPSTGAGSFHARVDLPRTDDDQHDVAAMLRAVICQHGSPMAALVVYSEDRAAAQRFADVFVPGLLEDGVEVIDVLRVGACRFYPLNGADHPGTAFDLASHPLTARGVLDGRVVHASRAALRESLVGLDEDDIADVSAAATVVVDALVSSGSAGESLQRILVEHAAWMRQRIDEYAAHRQVVSAVDAGRLLVLVSFEALREVAWSSMTRATARDQVDLWRSLVRRAPLDLRAGAAGLLAFAAWLVGDGALAWCAVDRCLEADPEDTLAQHVADLVEGATPPSVWAPVPVDSLRLFRVFDPASG